MSARKTGLALIRISGYHQNSDWVRVYIEHRISYSAAKEEYRRGYEMRQAGIKCSCKECNKEV